jgi:pSer/pThr/pTyr-binding forkhead associated (FHA) protein
MISAPTPPPGLGGSGRAATPATVLVGNEYAPLSNTPPAPPKYTPPIVTPPVITPPAGAVAAPGMGGMQRPISDPAPAPAPGVGAPGRGAPGMTTPAGFMPPLAPISQPPVITPPVNRPPAGNTPLPSPSPPAFTPAPAVPKSLSPKTIIVGRSEAPNPASPTHLAQARIIPRRFGALTDTEIPLLSSATVGRFDPTSGPVDIDLSTYPGGEHISRLHGRIDKTPTGWVVSDNNSANGVYIKPAGSDAFQPKLSAPHKLTDGDEIAFGNVVVVFRLS